MTGPTSNAAVPAENIRYGLLPVPRLGPIDVLVAVEAMTVNPVDTFVRSGAFATSVAFPFVIGRDLVGSPRDRVELPVTAAYTRDVDLLGLSSATRPSTISPPQPGCSTSGWPTAH